MVYLIAPGKKPKIKEEFDNYNNLKRWVGGSVGVMEYGDVRICFNNGLDDPEKWFPLNFKYKKDSFYGQVAVYCPADAFEKFWKEVKCH